MNVHKGFLITCCRVCASVCPQHQKGFPTKAYAKEIKTVYDISIATDIEEVHPKYLCKGCRNRFNKYRLAIQNKQSYTCNLPEPFTFRPHSENCQLCQNRSQKGRKEKVQYVKRIFNFEEHSIDTTKSETDTATDTGSETETGSEEPGPSATDLPDQTTAELQEPKPTTSTSTSYGQSKSGPPAAKKLRFEKEVSCEITSIDTERIHEKRLTEIFQCYICKGVPTNPIVTRCLHYYCKSCISTWFETANVCQVCRSFISTEDIVPLSGQLLLLYETMTISCKFT